MSSSEAVAAWPGFDKFNAVQEVLDRNKLLIGEINHNHGLKTPEALHRNAILIRELNNNVGRVADMYRELADVLATTPAPPDAFGGGLAAADSGPDA